MPTGAEAFSLEWEEALEHFRSLNVVDRAAFDQMSREARAASWTMAHVHAADALQSIHEELGATLAKGLGLREFEKAIQPYFTTPWHVETVFRTGILKAYGYGHWQGAVEGAKERPYVRYSAIMDMRTRPRHAELHGKVMRLDDAYVQDHWCPWEWNCRCMWVTLSQAEVEESGLSLSKGGDPDLPPSNPQFSSPALSGFGETHPNLRGLDPVLAGQVTEALAEAPPDLGVREADPWRDRAEALDYRKPGGISEYGRAWLEAHFPDEMAEMAAALRGEAAVSDGVEAATIMRERLAGEAVTGSNKLRFDRGWGKAERERLTQLRDEVEAVAGRPLKGLKFVERLGPNERAFQQGTKIALANLNPRTAWHEMGHVLEEDHKWVARASYAYRKSRALEAAPKPLNDIMKANHYSPRETALPTSFWHPYTGKVYGRSGAPTEVVSMGLQQFNSGRSLFDLYLNDPDHLYWLTGVIKGYLRYVAPTVAARVEWEGAVY